MRSGRAGTFFKRVYIDVHGNKKPLLYSIVAELHNLRDTRAPFPPGVPDRISLPDDVTVVLLADWGGDNEAAKNVADIMRKRTPYIGIHLGDIYYGGIREECEAFLCMWPFNTGTNEKPHFQPGRSVALNGNHEMYSGGESYVSVVLRAFGQPQPFSFWRISNGASSGWIRLTRAGM